MEMNEIIKKNMRDLVSETNEVLQSIYDHYNKITDLQNNLSKKVDALNLYKEKFGADFEMKVMPTVFTETFFDVEISPSYATAPRLCLKAETESTPGQQLSEIIEQVRYPAKIVREWHEKNEAKAPEGGRDVNAIR